MVLGDFEKSRASSFIYEILNDNDVWFIEQASAKQLIPHILWLKNSPKIKINNKVT